jgi:hypothetical protein
MKKQNAWPKPRPETQNGEERQKLATVGQQVMMTLFLYFSGNADEMYCHRN